MEDFVSLAGFLPAIGVLEVLIIVFSMLFMHFSAKHRNYQLSLGWYICGVVFGFWTLLIFLIKRKDFPGPKTKVCYQCGRKFPDSFQMCSNCLIDLPVINAEEKNKEKKLSKIFGVSVIVTLISTLITGIVFGATVAKDFDELLDMIDRIEVNGVFYDKKGNSYEDDKDVLLYDEEGRVYTYTEVEITDEADEAGELFTYTDYYYVRDDGEKYSAYDCYVTEDGWFYCDKGGFLEPFEEDTSSMNEEELDAYYQEQLEKSSSEYRYYNYPYTDKEGNIYYNGTEASWNEKGELITAENDVDITE